MDYFDRVIELARKGEGHTSPNPMVGAVIVKDNKVVGEGYHAKAGGDHAEVVALKKAGAKSKGATMYVNLEPCSHSGKTPPCIEAIIKSGIKKVVFGMKDPNPKVNGLGQKKLIQAGVDAICDNNLFNKNSLKLNEAFSKYISTGLPFVTLKWAMTLDGNIATASGDSQWISSDQSRKFVHKLRHQHDAVLVGVDTVLIDNPRLTVRHSDIITPSQPRAIVLDSQGRTPIDSNVVRDGTIIFSTKRLPASLAGQYISKGVEIIYAGESKVDLSMMLKKLSEMSITNLLVEGGSKVYTSFIRESLVDKAHIFISPKIVGGSGINPCHGKGVNKIAEAMNWRIDQTQQIGKDVLLTLYP